MHQKLRKTVNLASPLLMAALLAGLTCLPAEAIVFTVKLTNGTSIDTRYRPTQSPHDESKIQFLTEHGNWISLPKDLVESVDSDFESRGYGTVLDTNTIVLGYSPYEMPAEDGGAGDDQLDPTERLLNYMRSRDAAPPPFTVQQFVEPNSAGGIPIGFTGRTTPPIGSSGNEPPVAQERN